MPAKLERNRSIVFAALILCVSLVSYFAMLNKMPFIALAVLLVMILASIVILAKKRKYRAAFFVTLVACLVLYFGWFGRAEIMVKLFPVVLYSFLSGVFFYSCVGKSPAIITRIALAMKGPLAEEEMAYTRKVTLAWGSFLGALAVEALLLGLFAPVIYWALFINIVNYGLIILFFVIEYLVRVRVLSQFDHPGLISFLKKLIQLDYVRVFSRS